MTHYRMAPIFCVRPTGVAFDVLLRAGTPVIAEAAARLARLEADAQAAIGEALARTGIELADNRTLRSRLEGKLKRRAAMSAERLAAHPWLVPYETAIAAVRTAQAELEALIEREYRRVHDELVRAATQELPDFLVIESEDFASEVDRLAEEAPGAHTSKDRQRDRTLALYLQRVCAKNDTVSRFGPTAWGTVGDGDGLVLQLGGITARRVELERWAVKALIALANTELDVRPEIAPRLHPLGHLDEAGFRRLDDGREVVLDAEARALAECCDGVTPGHRLGSLARLASLAERGVICWELEQLAIDASPLASLCADVDGWRDGEARGRWRPRLEQLVALVRRFADDTSAPGRRAILAELRAVLAEIGIAPPSTGRTLYAARNPINENCLQSGTIELGARAAERMVDEVSPWFDLFGDAVAYAGARVFRRLHELIVAAPHRGPMRYATLARIAREHGPGIEDDRLHTSLAREVFGELRSELAGHLADRPDAPEWQLSADDCAFLRRRHRFPIGGELSYPSADLQVVAASIADAEAGRLEWLVAELHFAPVLTQHVFNWSCPDLPALGAAITPSFENRPVCVTDAFIAAPVHVCGEAMMTTVPDATYVGVGRPKRGWQAVRPADAELVIDEERCDIRLRHAGRDLGSIIRTPRLLMGLHPFFPLERAPHTPRLRVGNVVVQRRSWYIESTALGDRSTGVSAAFVSALERERAERGIPRWVFGRPIPGQVRAEGNFARDKDNKPLYYDLESVVFLDILERRLRKYGGLILTEMLPSPQQLIWSQPAGRIAFELRTNYVAR
jgi:hypothetical protein